MSEFNVTVDGGNSIRLKTAGKYCDRDIVVTAEGGTDERFKQRVEGTITKVIDSKITILYNNAFCSCVNLLEVDLPNVTTIKGEALGYCTTLQAVNLPKVTVVDASGFANCGLQALSLPSLTRLKAYALGYCSKLQVVDLPKVTEIENNAFYYDYSLKAVILRANTICKLVNTGAFKNCYHILGTKNSTYNPNGDKDGYFYVPRRLLGDDVIDLDYQIATNWSTYSTQFRALEDYTVDGTTTGELDWEKVNA